MCKRQFGFLVVAFLLTCTQAWAAGKVACSPAAAPAAPADVCTVGESSFPCITLAYSPNVTSNTFNFGGDSIQIKFRKVLRDFSLTIIRHSMTTTEFQGRLDPGVFPEGSTCYVYFNATPFGSCTPYDAAEPLPQKGTDYLGPVTWTLTYFANDFNSNPALGHAKGTSFTYTEDILQFYFTSTEDPTMQGNSDGLSSAAAIKELLTETDSFCWVSPSSGQTFQVGQEVEVEFRLFPNNLGCTSNPGTPIRDKDARMSVATFDNTGLVFVPVRGDEGGNRHFHFEHDEGVNEREFETEGLAPGTYIITVFSNKFSPQTRTFRLQ
ncbi:MAG: hypothetical protein WAR21_06355 [Candidatus Acidiferrales bacterium]